MQNAEVQPVEAEGVQRLATKVSKMEIVDT
jgi:hypothetical protein